MHSIFFQTNSHAYWRYVVDDVDYMNQIIIVTLSSHTHSSTTFFTFFCASLSVWKKKFELVLRHCVILLLIIVILIAIKKYHIFDRLNTYSVVIIKLWSDQKENFVCHQYHHFYYHHNHLLHSIYQYTLPKKIKKGRFFFSVNQVEQWKLSN